MAGYKASYKILRQQGEDMKAVAKLVDGYSERVAQVSAKLGEGELLSEVRTNLGKLREQLTESRTILHVAGDFLTKTVDNYTGAELRLVKKSDGTRAHQRDFYKNPVVVASVGGAVSGAGVAAAMPTSAPVSSAPSVTYVDNSVNVNYVAVEAAPVAPAPVAAPVSAPAPAPVSAPAFTAAPVAAPVASVGAGGVAGIAAGVGVVGGALGAGAVMGVKHLLEQDKAAKGADKASEKNAQAAAVEDAYDPEEELAKAIARVKELEEEDA